jgi:hypothetical protein
VADVEEDRAVSDLRQLTLAQHPVEPHGSDDHARCADGGGHLGNTAHVVLCLDEPHRNEIDDVTTAPRSRARAATPWPTGPNPTTAGRGGS